MEKMQKLNLRMQKLNLRMQKLNLRMQKLDFPGTHWRGLALIGAQKKPLLLYVLWFASRSLMEELTNATLRNNLSDPLPIIDNKQG